MATHNDSLFIRLKDTDKANFKKKCKGFPVESADMLREMIVAFNENRLTIEVPKNQMLILKGVHHVN